MSDFAGKTLVDSGLKHYTRRLTANYFLAMALVGVLALSLFCVLFAQINSQGRYATMIGAANRQRALAQRAALFCLRLTQEPDAAHRQELRAITTRAVADLERIQRGLIQGDVALALPGRPGAEIEALYRDQPTDLDRRVGEFCRTVRALVARAADAPLPAGSPELGQVLAAVPGALLTALDEAVAAYEHANHRTTRRLQAVETVLVALLLVTLFAELRLVFRPMVRAILRETLVQTATRRRHTAVLNAVGEAILTLDADNVILTCNPEAERLWGQPAEEIIGRPASALVLPGRDLDPAGWRGMFPPGRRAESVGVRAGGEAFPLEVRLEETASDPAEEDRAARHPGRRVHTLCARDISERVEASRQVAAARDAALDTARARSEFVANVSHELRTPMNGVLGAADLLEATPLSAEQHDLLETIRTSGDSLLTVINDILDFSKMEAGKMSLETISLDLRQLVESTADVLAGRALQKHLELVAFIEPGTPTQFVGDPGRLRQVLLNLLGNAIKFTKAGEVVLRVGCEAADAAGATLRFSVRDTGVGIDPVARGRLFQAFSQAEDSTARHFGGTGLGLTISQQLVELMGGRIDVDSTPGKGSTFWFTARFAFNPEAPQAPEHQNPALEALRGMRVLIVDDNATLRTCLQQRLAAWEMAADSAEDAGHTLAIMREKAEAGTPYDLALLDLNLGSMDGFTLAWAITNQPALARTRIILVTSLGVESDRHAYTQIGIWASVTKPIKYHTLLNTLAQVVGSPAAPPAHPEPASRRPKTSAHEPVPLRVLLAEDNAINRKLALRQLHNLGHRAESVENGLEALAALDAGTYDVVLLDMHMPVMDGCQAALTIRQHEAQLGKRRQTLIALTASAAGADRERCLSSGMDDFLGKPVRQDELAKALARWTPVNGAPTATVRTT